MRKSEFKIGKSKNPSKIAAVCLLILIIAFSSFAQYKGAPVKKER